MSFKGIRISGNSTTRQLIILILLLIPLFQLTPENTGSGNKVPSFELFMARRLYSKKNYEEAAKFFEIARNRKEVTPDDLVLMGLCYIKLKETDKAEAILKEAAKLNPNTFALNIALGSLYFERRDFKTAYTCFEKAKKLHPDSRQALQGMIASLINSGVEEYARGNRKRAKYFFKRALTLNPNSAEAFRNLGIVYENEGDTKKAIELFYKALQINPNDPVLLRLLAETLKKKGDRDKLFKTLNRLANISPQSPYPYENLAILYEERGNLKKALSAFKKAIKNGSEEPYPYYIVAREEFKRGNAKQAVSTLYLAIGNAVHKISSLKLRAAARIKRKKGKLNKEDIEALKQYSLLIKEPKNVLLDSIKLLQKIDGDNKTFERDIRKLSGWYPYNIELKEALANILEKEGKLRESYKTWLKILETNPTNATAHKQIAKILLKQGKINRAILEYRRALDLNPEDQSVYDSLLTVYKKEKREAELLQILKNKYLTQRHNKVLITNIIKLLNIMGNKEEAKTFRERLEKLTAGR